METSIGQRLKERRIELGITQKEVEKYTSLSSGNISCIENNQYKPSAEALIKLSEIYDCSTDWILKGSAKDQSMFLVSKKDEIELIENYRKLIDKDKKEILHLINYKVDNKDI